MTEETKKVNFHQLLKDKRGLLVSLRKDVELQGKKMEGEYHEKQQACLSERQKGINAIRDKGEVEKQKFKHMYDVAKNIALDEYKQALDTLTKKRDDDLKAAHELKEIEYRRIRKEVEDASGPLILKHKEETKELEDKFRKALEQHLKAGEEAIKTLQKEIEELEQEIDSRAEKRSKASKPQDAPAQTP